MASAEQRLGDDAAARDLVIVHDDEPARAVAAGVGGVERCRAVEPEDHLGDFVFLHLAALQTVQLRGVYDAENALEPRFHLGSAALEEIALAGAQRLLAEPEHVRAQPHANEGGFFALQARDLAG